MTAHAANRSVTTRTTCSPGGARSVVPFFVGVERQLWRPRRGRPTFGSRSSAGCRSCAGMTRLRGLITRLLDDQLPILLVGQAFLPVGQAFLPARIGLSPPSTCARSSSGAAGRPRCIEKPRHALFPACSTEPDAKVLTPQPIPRCRIASIPLPFFRRIDP